MTTPRFDVLAVGSTGAGSLVTGFELRSRFESGKGVALAGCLPGTPFPPRPGKTSDVSLAPGEVAELLARPLGNHLVLVPGNRAARLRDYRDGAVVS